MSWLLGLLVVAVMAIPLAVAIYRSNELFRVDVRNGVGELSRGRIPQRLLDDVNEIMRRPVVKRAVLRVVKEDGRARVIVAGDVAEGQRQQLRNVVGTWEIAKLRAGGKRR